MSLVFINISSVIMMAAPQTSSLPLVFVSLVFLLLCADSTDFTDRKFHTISRTASQGDTVVFHCNVSVGKGVDVGWLKEESVLFNYSPVINQSMTNYTSSRMYVDPNNPLKLQISNVQPSDAGNYSCFSLKTQWILTIKVSETKAELHREMLPYIVLSVTAVIAACFIIFFLVWIYRKWKKKQAADISGTRDEHAKLHQNFHLHRDMLTSCEYTLIHLKQASIDTYRVAI